MLGAFAPDGSSHSATGAGIPDGGDIKLEDTLGAVGKTIGAALGIGTATMDDEILSGKVVKAAIV